MAVIRVKDKKWVLKTKPTVKVNTDRPRGHGRPPIDLAGQDIPGTLWHVVRLGPPHTLPCGVKKVTWICVCRGCGNKEVVIATALSQRTSRCCRNCRTGGNYARNLEMVRLRRKNPGKWSLNTLARRYGISVARVSYILQRDSKRMGYVKRKERQSEAVHRALERGSDRAEAAGSHDRPVGKVAGKDRDARRSGAHRRKGGSHPRRKGG